MAKARTRTRYITRRLARRRRSHGLTIPLAILAGLAPTAAFAWEGFKLNGGQGPDGGLQEAAHRLTMRLTGYEWKGKIFNFGELAQGWLPLFLGAGAHKLANKFGVNRMLANAGIPLIRI